MLAGVRLAARGPETGEFMKSFLYRPLAWIIAILLLPACWGAAFSFGKNLPSAFLTGGAGSFMHCAGGLGLHRGRYRIRPLASLASP